MNIVDLSSGRSCIATCACKVNEASVPQFQSLQAIPNGFRIWMLSSPCTVERVLRMWARTHPNHETMFLKLRLQPPCKTHHSLFKIFAAVCIWQLPPLVQIE